VRPHFCQRIHHPPHRPPRQRFVAEQARTKWLCRQNAGEHTDGRAGIAGIEIGRRRAQAGQSAALNGKFGPSPATSIPSARRQPSVERQSAPVE